MTAEQFISHAIPALHLYDTGESALLWMNLLSVHHLPVVENSRYIGLASFDSLQECGVCSIGSLMKRQPDTSHLCVLNTQHVYDALKLVSENQLTIAPVVDPDHRYLGSIGTKELLDVFSQVVNVQEAGDTIILEMHPNDFELKKIASIVESDGGKILNFYTSPLNASQLMQVHLKVAGRNTSAIVQSLERFGFQVAGVFSDSKYLDDAHDHYNQLMRFLNL